MKKLSITLLIIFICRIAECQPSVSSTSGTISHGNSITISGSNFGSKATPAPVIWDNMESGSISGSWSEVNETVINSDNNRHSNSSYNGFYNYDQGTVDETCGFAGGSDSQTWFVQYWFKLGSNWDWGTTTFGGGDEHLANVKIFRMWSTGAETDNFHENFHGWNAGGNVFETCENVSAPTGAAGYFWPDVETDFSLNTWHLLQFEFKDSTLSTQDGEFRLWFNGGIKRSATDLKTRDGTDVYKRPKVVGFHDGWNGGNPGDNYMWIDDAYIDNTWARVEIGDNSDYGSCTHREIQIPTAWSGTSITATVNQGSYTSGEGAFLFVIDSDAGTSTGFAISFASDGVSTFTSLSGTFQ